MATRSVLTVHERKLSSYWLPEGSTSNELLAYFLLEEEDLVYIFQQRGASNRLGFALQLVYLRYLGYSFQNVTAIPDYLVEFIGKQLGINDSYLSHYGKRPATRLEHLKKLKIIYGFQSFTSTHYRKLSHWLQEIAIGLDSGNALLEELLRKMRADKIILPALSTLEQLVFGARERARKRTIHTLTQTIEDRDKKELESLLTQLVSNNISYYAWLNQPSGRTSHKNLQIILEKLTFLNKLQLPLHTSERIHPNLRHTMVKQGRSYTAQQIQQLKEPKKWAYLIIVLSDIRSYLIDESINMSLHLVNKMKNSDERKATAAVLDNRKDLIESTYIHAKVGQALIHAKDNSLDPFEVIEEIISWDEYKTSIFHAEQLFEKKRLPESLSLLTRHYGSLRRFFPKLLTNIELLSADVTKPILEAIHYLIELNKKGKRKLTSEAPIAFIKPKWASLISKNEQSRKTYYEFHLFLEMCYALKSGDMWIVGSKQYRNLEDYLYPKNKWVLLDDQQLQLPKQPELYLSEMKQITDYSVKEIEALITKDLLPDLKYDGEKISLNKLKDQVPPEAKAFGKRIYSMMPRTKLTELILDSAFWTELYKEFPHIHTNDFTNENTCLYSAILADGTNLGLSRMAEACPTIDYNQLYWFYTHHMREENYINALGVVTDYQSKHPYAQYWGTGQTSSSDGQFFSTRGQTTSLSKTSAKYGKNKGVSVYTHVNDQYSPFYAQLISSSEEAAHIIDGLLYHKSEQQIDEHYTDAAGYSYQVFGLCQLLGIQFSPRIKHLEKRTLSTLTQIESSSPLNFLYSGSINVALIKECWDDLLRLGYSVQTRTVKASEILKKLASYPRQNKLAAALKELGKIPCGLHLLKWIHKTDYRQHVQHELNKGEAKHSLTRALQLQESGEIRAQSYENQVNHANGLNLLIGLIVYWNTTYIEEIVNRLRMNGEIIEEEHLKHVSPLGWEHIIITGDYIWTTLPETEVGALRPLRNID